jgi:hypothetical protein
MKNGLHDRGGLLLAETAATRLSDEFGSLGLGQSLEADAHLIDGPGAPTGPLVEQLRPGRDQHQHPARTLPATRGDPLDQIQHLRPKRLRVLEQERDGALLSEPLEQRQEARADVVHERGLVPSRLRQSHECLQSFGRAFLIITRDADASDQFPQALRGEFGGIVVIDTGDLAHHRGRRCERGAVGTQMAPPDQDGAFRVEPGDELGREPGFPDARLAHQREQERT